LQQQGPGAAAIADGRTTQAKRLRQVAGKNPALSNFSGKSVIDTRNAGITRICPCKRSSQRKMALLFGLLFALLLP
jgi:hypothetical protein